MQYTNAQILAAVLAKWGQPAIEQLTSGKLDNLPWMQAVSNKVRSMGWDGCRRIGRSARSYHH